METDDNRYLLMDTDRLVFWHKKGQPCRDLHSKIQPLVESGVMTKEEARKMMFGPTGPFKRDFPTFAHWLEYEEKNTGD